MMPFQKLDAPAPKREPLQKLGEAERIERPDRLQGARNPTASEWMPLKELGKAERAE